MTHRSILFAALVAVAGCNGCKSPCAPSVGVCPRPAPVVAAPDGGDLCSRACEKLMDNGCLSADASVSACAASCADDQAAGIGSMLDPAGVIDAGTVADLNRVTGFMCTGPAGDR